VRQQSGIAQWRQYPSWARGPARMVGDEVVLDEDRARLCHIYEPADLMFELAELAADWDSRDTRDVLAFVGRNGLLWHGPKDLGTGECREPLDKWWIESRILALLINLYAGLKDSIEKNSTLPLRQTLADFTEVFQATPPEPDDQTLMEQTSVYLAEAVTTQLEGCHMGLTSSVLLDVRPRDPGIFLLSQRPPDLLTAAYVQFAQAIANRAPVEECPGCGRMFIPQSGKQMYCTKSCASTSRWRRWKARQNSE
jgi:hypothetical protein